MLPFCLPVSFLLAYFSFWESQVWNPTWYFFFFFLSLRFSSSCFLHMAAQNGGIERPAATRYITLRNTLPGHHLISCFQCGSEAATPQTHYTLTTFAIVTSATASGWHPITLPHKRLGLSGPQQCSGSKTVPDTSYCKIL